MGNGNNLIVGGIINYQEIDGSFIYNLIPQIYNAANGSLVTLSNASRLVPTYPWMYAAPGGAVNVRRPWLFGVSRWCSAPCWMNEAATNSSLSRCGCWNVS